MGHHEKLPLLLYDEECSLCSRFADLIKRTPQNPPLFCIPLQEESLYEEFTFLDKEKCKQEVHLIDKNLQVHVGKDCLNYLAKHSPYVEKISWLLDTKMGDKATAIFYNSLNRIRTFVTRECESCKKTP